MVSNRRTLKSFIEKRRKLWSNSSKECKRRRSVKLVKAYLFAQEAYSLMTKNDGPLLHIAAREGREDLFKSLLAIGTDPNLRGALGCTALHEAAARGNTEVMRELLVHGADVAAKTVTGQSPLHWAADVGQYGAVLVLLSAGAELDAATIFGYTAQDFAKSHGHERTISLLDFCRRSSR